MGYRPWDPQKYEKPAQFLIVLRSDENTGKPNLVMRTTQYELIRRPLPKPRL
jgi:hypothetical protein